MAGRADDKPFEIVVNGKTYVPVVLQTKSFDDDGRPRLLRLLREDEVTEIENGQYWVAFVPIGMTVGRS